MKPRRRPTPKWVLALVVGLPFVLAGGAALMVSGGPGNRWIGGAVLGAAVVGAFVVGLVRILARPAADRRLGEPHAVEGVLLTEACSVPPGAHRFRGTLTISTTDVAFDPAPGPGARKLRFPLTAIRVVRVRPADVYVEWDDGVPRALCVEGDRKRRDRLLWELAVRAPEAVERGLRDAADATPGASGSLSAARPADAAAAMSDLDARMESLGSSLIPPRTAQPAPPRSPLGNGLFVAPPRDEDDGTP